MKKIGLRGRRTSLAPPRSVNANLKSKKNLKHFSPLNQCFASQIVSFTETSEKMHEKLSLHGDNNVYQCSYCIFSSFCFLEILLPSSQLNSVRISCFFWLWEKLSMETLFSWDTFLYHTVQSKCRIRMPCPPQPPVVKSMAM